ncbi:MAG TPA: carboxypeptidase-like regulatory domain-containing protein [Candidatus Angelobacter sp.]|nr:carboxypeptidase-like regulatory domain-containing protein [Candidatus Angelobacter sp.]
MSYQRAELPLDSAAYEQADDQFYADHPELIEDGQRISLDPDDPSQAELRSEWMDVYYAKTNRPAPVRPFDKRPCDTSTSCLGDLVVRVVDQDGKPVKGAEVKADGLTKISDVSGYAHFRRIPVKVYDISASKQGYGKIDTYPHTANVPAATTTLATLGLRKCVTYRLTSPKLVASGSEGLLPPITSFPIQGSIGGALTLDFDQHFTFGTRGKLAAGWEVGSTKDVLIKKMSHLLNDFAWDDKDKIAEREFKAFQSQKTAPEIYTDPNLDKAVPLSENFKDYPARVLAAPPIVPPAGKARIHQVLKAAGWDINAVKPITDLGVPALNAGESPGLFSKSTKDRATGLFALIDTVNHVLVFVETYEFDSCKQEYTIQLVFELYDVFGIDDDNIKKFGYGADVLEGKNWTNDAEAVTAWWQLQHQFGFAPLITKVVVRPKPFTVSTR